MGQLGVPEMLVILVVALLVFGPKKLPELGSGLGKAIKDFKNAVSEKPEIVEPQEKPGDTSAK